MPDVNGPEELNAGAYHTYKKSMGRGIYKTFYRRTESPYYQEPGTVFPRKMRPGDVVVDRRLVRRDPEESKKVIAEIEARIEILSAPRMAALHEVMRDELRSGPRLKALKQKIEELDRKLKFQNGQLQSEMMRLRSVAGAKSRIPSDAL